MSQSVFYCNYTIGEDAYARLPQICRAHGQRLLVIGGETALQRALPALEQAVEGGGLSIDRVLRFGGECTEAAVESLAAACLPADGAVVVGVGGGKALDTAKAVAARLGRPVVTLPTIAATCAATSALSVLYRPDGRHDRFLQLGAPPLHCFLHTGILAQAPSMYLRGGMGDALGKFFESHFVSRGVPLGHASALGRQISVRCHDAVLLYGLQAMIDCENGEDSPALREVVLANIVTTGLASLLLEERYSGAVAHSVAAGLAQIEGMEQRALHGDLVAYGVLVQLVLDDGEERAVGLSLFLRRLGIPVCLGDLGLGEDDALLGMALRIAADFPDMANLPYPVDAQRLYEAVLRLEQLP